MAVAVLAGLFIASRAGSGTFYWMGLLVALLALLKIFELIRAALDEAEGKATERGVLVPLMLVLVAVGTLLFHILSPWWWSPIASNWRYIDDTINLTFWITGVVFVAIVLFMAYCVYHFRYREGRRAEYEPENRKLEWWLTVGTGVGVAAMLAPGLFVWQQFVAVPHDAHEVEIVGRQWSWSYRMPGADGRLGTSDVRHTGPDNPLGLNPSDADGQDDLVVESGDLLLPVGRPVKLLLRSIDVLHNFYVPEFRAKMDMVPGMVTFVWLTPTRTGTFEVICAELCGVGHAFMRGTVAVVEEPVYQAWLEQQQTFAVARQGEADDGPDRAEAALVTVTDDTLAVDPARPDPNENGSAF
ncbi:MAG TPA: cytochrome c oxidase subunit II [Geminicoccaceae bacterium]|nr:cytochrome c oxidase subunit II [Geminicoccaceae bacterium]